MLIELGILFFVLACCATYKLRARPLSSGVASPAAFYPVIGSLVEMGKNAQTMPNWALEKAEQAHWQPWGTSMPGQRFYFVQDEATIRYILQDSFDSFEKGATFQEHFEELLQQGIFAVDGEAWRTERRIASHLFSARLLRQMNTVFVEKARLLAQRLRTSYAQSGEALDLQKEFCRFTFGAFAQVAFGFDIDQDAAAADRFSVAFDKCQLLCSMRFFSPPPLWKLQRLLNLGAERELANEARVLYGYIERLVDDRLPRTVAAVEASLAESEEESRACNESDLLSLFVHYGYEQKRPELIAPRYIAQMVTNFLLAGRDTTACLLTFLHKYLSEQPAFYDRFEAEVRHATQDGQQLEDVCKPAKAPFVHACLLETLRIAPPVAVDSKIARLSATLPNGIAIEQGDIVSYSPILIGRSPRFFEDPLVFDPERFLPADGKPVKKAPPFLRSECAVLSDYQFPVFNAGHRICLGKTLAQNEAKLVAAIFALAGLRFEKAAAATGPELYRVPIMMLFDGLKMHVRA